MPRSTSARGKVSACLVALLLATLAACGTPTAEQQPAPAGTEVVTKGNAPAGSAEQCREGDDLCLFIEDVTASCFEGQAACETVLSQQCMKDLPACQRTFERGCARDARACERLLAPQCTRDPQGCAEALSTEPEPAKEEGSEPADEPADEDGSEDTGDAEEAAPPVPCTVDSCPIGSIGPGGGIVFYDAGAVQGWGRYLEAAPAGWSGGQDPTAKWCPQKKPGWSANAVQAGLGAGRPNTQWLLSDAAQCGGSSAAGLAAAYRGGGKSDWFLPSAEELDSIYQERSSIPGLAAEEYWSSSSRCESGAEAWQACFQMFDDDYLPGEQGLSVKHMDHRVRPVRAFASPADTAPAGTGITAKPLKPVAPAPGNAANQQCGAGACQVGATGPGGGVVFYDAGSPQPWGRYLEAAPTGWAGGSQDPTAKWCDRNKYGWGWIGLQDLLESAIGSGKSNTRRILEPATQCGTTASAAVLASSYRGGGKNDWFLPSEMELDALYENRSLVGGFTTEEYWSSSARCTQPLTEEIPSLSCSVMFSDDFLPGLHANAARNIDYRVRPIRAFP